MAEYTKPVAEFDLAEESIQSHAKRVGRSDGACNSPNNGSVCIAYDIDE
jgi:hypothetical protein